MEHVISVLVENRFGVLAHIAGMFSGRGFNIDSLAVGETLDPAVSRMTIVVRGDDSIVEQILKQLNRQVDVVKQNAITVPKRRVLDEVIHARRSVRKLELQLGKHPDDPRIQQSNAPRAAEVVDRYAFGMMKCKPRPEILT